MSQMHLITFLESAAECAENKEVNSTSQDKFFRERKISEHFFQRVMILQQLPK